MRLTISPQVRYTILDKFHTDIDSEDSGSDNEPEEG